MTGMTASIWSATATFRRSTAEKAGFFLLNQLDLLLTALAVYLGIGEMNPLMRYLLTVPVLLVLVKTGIPLLIAWLVPGRLLLPALALLTLVVTWNIKELLVFFGQCFARAG